MKQVKRSLLEIKFEVFFKVLNIEYSHSYRVNAKTRNFVYDFYLPKYNILIEVDGDFWHCNPNTKHKLPKFKTQKANVINDQRKDNWAKNNGFKLLRFWESDINTNPQQIIESLKKEFI